MSPPTFQPFWAASTSSQVNLFTFPFDAWCGFSPTSLRKFVFRELFKLVPMPCHAPLPLHPQFVCLCGFYYCGTRLFIFCHWSDLIKVCVGPKIIRAEEGVRKTKFVFSESLERVTTPFEGATCFRFRRPKVVKSQKSNLFRFYCLHLLAVLVCVCVFHSANVMRCFDPLTWSFLLTPSFSLVDADLVWSLGQVLLASAAW